MLCQINQNAYYQSENILLAWNKSFQPICMQVICMLFFWITRIICQSSALRLKSLLERSLEFTKSGERLASWKRGRFVLLRSIQDMGIWNRIFSRSKGLPWVMFWFEDIDQAMAVYSFFANDFEGTEDAKVIRINKLFPKENYWWSAYSRDNDWFTEY